LRHEPLFLFDNPHDAGVRQTNAWPELASADMEVFDDKSNQLVASAFIVSDFQNANQETPVL